MEKVYAVVVNFEGFCDMEYVDKMFGSVDSATEYVESMKLENPDSEYRIDEWEVE